MKENTEILKLKIIRISEQEKYDLLGLIPQNCDYEIDIKYKLVVTRYDDNIALKSIGGLLFKMSHEFDDVIIEPTVEDYVRYAMKIKAKGYIFNKKTNQIMLAEIKK